MTEVQLPKGASAIEPCIRYTPAEVIRNKKARDERRKAIRLQNARTKTL